MVDVLVAGGGPTGMMLAGELTLAGVDVAIVERRPTTELAGSRGGGFHSRTIEILDQRGIADRFLNAGTIHQGAAMGSAMLDVSDFPTRHPYTLGLWQNRIERILAGWIEELGVAVLRGREVTGFDQGEHGVAVRLADGDSLRASYLVGADGGRSLVRKTAGIEFPGSEPTRSNLLAEVAMSDEFPEGVRHDDSGIHGLSYMEDGQTVRVMLTEGEPGADREPTLGDLSVRLQEVYGEDFGVQSPTWITRFTDATRQAASLRAGRVLLAGDAAHIHYPAGGQGIGLGIQDAVNLGWKLAQVVRGVSSEGLLDSYHDERHPVVARVLKQTMAMEVLQRPGVRVGAVRALMDELMEMDAPRRHVAGLLSGLDVHYDLGEGHPLLGRRMPDLDLDTAGGPTRVFELLHDARAVLLNLGEPGSLDPGPWADRVELVEASYDGPWELPVIGAVSDPVAVLIRPDGHVAWVSDGTQSGLEESLTTWFGQASALPLAGGATGR